jgi:hypothetical protein
VDIEPVGTLLHRVKILLVRVPLTPIALGALAHTGQLYLELADLLVVFDHLGWLGFFQFLESPAMLLCESRGLNLLVFQLRRQRIHLHQRSVLITPMIKYVRQEVKDLHNFVLKKIG